MSKSKYQGFKFDEPFLVLNTEESFNKSASGKSWRKDPHTVEKRVFTAKEYQNFIESIPFFNNWGGGASCRGFWAYTKAGYLPTRVLTVSPGGKEKQRNTFKFISLYDLLKNSGWREKEIVKNAIYFEMERVGDRDILTLITLDKGVTACGEFDVLAKKWVG